jgi:autotransporter-associated beta strand protein
VLRLGVSNALPTVRSLTLGTSTSNATFDLFGFNQTVAGLTAVANAGSTTGQKITNNAASGTSVFTMNNDASNSNADFAFGGVIQDGPTATTALTKTGSRTFTLAGANTYTGDTTVVAGKLALANTGSLASLKITVGTSPGSAAVLDVSAITDGLSLSSGQTLGGHGTVVGNVAVSGTVSPGAAGVGELVENGTQTWAGGGNYAWEITDAAEGADGNGSRWDHLTLTTLNITATAASRFKITVSGHPTNLVTDGSHTYRWAIANAASPPASFSQDEFQIDSSQFSGFPDHAFHVEQVGGEIDLVFVPEPGTVGTILGGAGLLTSRRRRCRRRAVITA